MCGVKANSGVWMENTRLWKPRVSELKDCAGKQTDGSAKTREVKRCTVWSAESWDAGNRPVRDKGSVTYTAAIESAATLDTDTVASTLCTRGKSRMR
jgi:hypothetical protein